MVQPKRPDVMKILSILPIDKKKITQDQVVKILGLDEDIARHRPGNYLIDDRFLIVRTRQGLANRESLDQFEGVKLEKLQRHPSYIMDWDAKDDGTVAYVLFDITDLRGADIWS